MLSAPGVQDCRGEAQLQQSSQGCGSLPERRAYALQEWEDLDMFLFSEFSIAQLKQQKTAWCDFLQSNCDFLPFNSSHSKNPASPNSYSRREDDGKMAGEEMAKQHQGPVTKTTHVMGKTRGLCSVSRVREPWRWF